MDDICIPACCILSPRIFICTSIFQSPSHEIPRVIEQTFPDSTLTATLTFDDTVTKAGDPTFDLCYHLALRANPTLPMLWSGKRSQL